MASMSMIRSASISFGRQNLATVRSASTATVAAAKDKKPHQAPHGTHHVRAAHHVMCTSQTSTFHLKPEVRNVQFLQWCRQVMPKFMHSAQGKVLGVPGPRSLSFQNDKTQEYTAVHLWQSAEAVETHSQSAEHHELMRDFGAFGDADTIKQEVNPHTDVFYYASMEQSNLERYPIESLPWLLKPGSRQQLTKCLTENKKYLQWVHDAGVLCLVLKYNDAQDQCTSFAVFKDLLKWEAMYRDFDQKLMEWGVADLLAIPDLKEACAQFPAPHSNAWVYSE